MSNETPLLSRLEDLENQIERLGERLIEAEKALLKIKALGQDFWRREATVVMLGVSVKSWRYDAKDQNFLFPDALRAQPINETRAKRWIRKGGELSATVAINRTV